MIELNRTGRELARIVVTREAPSGVTNEHTYSFRSSGYVMYGTRARVNIPGSTVVSFLPYDAGQWSTHRWSPWGESSTARSVDYNSTYQDPAGMKTFPQVIRRLLRFYTKAVNSPISQCSRVEYKGTHPDFAALYVDDILGNEVAV